MVATDYTQLFSYSLPALLQPSREAGQLSRRSSSMYVSRHFALIIGLTVVYYLAGRAGLHFFGLLHPSASAIWIPTGIAIASLLIFGYRVWPAIFTGALLVNLTTQGSLLTSLGMAAGNTLEGILAAYLVGRFAGGTAAFARASNIFRFAGVGVVAGATVSATIGVVSLTLGGYAPADDFGAIWFTWWLGDAAGAIVVTPLLVLWYGDRQWSWPTWRVIESALLLASLVLVGSMTFFHPRLASYPLAFLCLGPLVLAAFRFGQREVATAVALLALIATWATATGHGPFIMQTPNESLLVLQGFHDLYGNDGTLHGCAYVGAGGPARRERKRAPKPRQPVAPKMSFSQS